MARHVNLRLTEREADAVADALIDVAYPVEGLILWLFPGLQRPRPDRAAARRALRKLC